MSTKYDEAAFLTNNNQYDLLKLEDAIVLAKKDDQEFQKKYHDRLYCPECHEPKLTFVSNNGKYYFRGFPQHIHTPICSKGFDPISTTSFQTFALDTTNHDFLLQRLQRFVFRKLQRNNNNTHPLLLQIQNDRISHDDVQPATIRNRQLIRRIPTKSITAPFHDEDLACYKLFYGSVNIQYSKIEKQDYSFFKLDLLRRSDSSVICSLSFSQGVATHLESDYGLVLNQRLNNQYVAFFSVMKQNNQYLNARLSHSKLFYIIAE
ncbi:MAG: hypothetical protein IKI45_09120 [Oscillospiraceae bacterium]|nr:hypothetical protein [Oscillospiraceae bacterium]